ncbi:cytochrome P450 [Actinobacteria bacterium OK074]|nr:cytochrome P450 [Actinobacteria bacterium OK074]
MSLYYVDGGPEPAYVRGWSACRRLLAGPELVSDAARAGLDREPGNNMLFLDGDLHRDARRLIREYFTRSRLADLAAHLEEYCAALVRDTVGRPGADLVAELAEPLVLEGIMAAMDIPAERRETVGALTRGMLGMLEPDLSPPERRRTANAALRTTLLFERDGTAGRATGFHARLEEAARAGTLPLKLARSTPTVLLHGGYENPLNQLGCLLAWAVTHPAAFREAAERAPDILFEEVMRVHSPVRLLPRWSAADSGEVTEGQIPLRRGQFAWVDLESANHDPDRFPDAHAVDLTRRRGHLGFGHGRHLCPGASLARLEGRVLIAALAAVDPDVLGDFTVTWREGFVARGPLTMTRR